ncbi:MAG TPA: hypothetical protein VIU12_25415 [Chryseolinea sp.]
MKRSFSIFLLLVFLFNVVGYYPVFWGLKYRARIEMNQRLDDENYNTEETVTIKIPLTVPYNTFGQDYERMTGSFEHRGEFFNLIKQKLEKDTLYIVCIKDHKEKQLHAAMTDFIKLSTDIPTSSQQTLKLLSGLIKDYIPTTPQALTQNRQGQSLTYGATPDFNLLANNLPVPTPPPDRLA